MAYNNTHFYGVRTEEDSEAIILCHCHPEVTEFHGAPEGLPVAGQAGMTVPGDRRTGLPAECPTCRARFNAPPGKSEGAFVVFGWNRQARRWRPKTEWMNRRDALRLAEAFRDANPGRHFKAAYHDEGGWLPAPGGEGR